MNVQLILGDSLDALADISSGMIRAVITDPPYGKDYQSCRRPALNRKAKIVNDKEPFVAWLDEAYRVTADGGSLLCFCDWTTQEVFRAAIASAGFTVKSQVIWDREWHGLGDLNAQFAPQHDVIWFATKGRFVFPDGRPTSVIRCKRVDAEALVHPNEKPIPLMAKLIRTVTRRGDTVLDPFAGSGATAVACVQTGRNCITCEIDPAYYRLAESRIALARTQAPLLAIEDEADDEPAPIAVPVVWKQGALF